MVFRFLIILILLPYWSFAQLKKGMVYSFHYGPGQLKSLCASQYLFLDSVGYWSSGCENHVWQVGKFIYKTDSTKIICEYIPYAQFNPIIKINRKNIDGQRDIKVTLIDVFGKKSPVDIAVIKLKRKKDVILKSYSTNHLSDILSFPVIKGKNIFWTLKSLYPIFFSEIHFSYKEPYNYYEIYLDLPSNFLTVTEGKRWVEGKRILEIQDNRHIIYSKDIYECCEY